MEVNNNGLYVFYDNNEWRIIFVDENNIPSLHNRENTLLTRLTELIELT